MPRAHTWLLSLLGSCALLQCHPTVTTVYVVRHAEKAQGQGKDPVLTPVGHTRARALARVLEGVELDGIYASEYRRTIQTVKPAADARSTDVVVLPGGDTAAVIDRVRGKHRGRRLLIAGHYNTVPDLIRALGVREAVQIGHDDHGDLFVVTIADNGGATLEHRRFDP